jgi:hypothetical protein
VNLTVSSIQNAFPKKEKEKEKRILGSIIVDEMLIRKIL